MLAMNIIKFVRSLAEPIFAFTQQSYSVLEFDRQTLVTVELASLPAGLTELSEEIVISVASSSGESATGLACLQLRSLGNSC